MADQRKVESENLTLKLSSRVKRVYNETHLSDDKIDLNNSSLNYDQSSTSFSAKRFKAYPYRDQNTESQDTDSLRNTSGIPGLTDSFDSGSWSSMSTSSPPSTSRTPSLASLELSSIIKRYDKATLNSLSMSQMSNFSDNATFSSIPQTFDMASPSTSKSISSLDLTSPAQKYDNVTLDSISWSQVSMMSFSQGSVTNQASDTVEMASLSSQTSQTDTEEIVCGHVEAKHDSDFFPVRNDAKTKVNTHISSVTDTGPLKNQSPNTAISGENLGGDEYQPGKNLPHGKTDSFQKVKTRKSDKLNNRDDGQSTTEDQSDDDKNRDDSDSNTSINIENESNPELKENFKTCKKNPGHEKFFSPKELKVTDLPQDIQHEDSVTFFQCLSNLVVQISVSSTSERRSVDDVYNSYKGTKKKRYGSGFIVSTDRHIMSIKCTRKDCPHKVVRVEGNETAGTSKSPSFDRTLSNLSTCSSASISSNDSIVSSGLGRRHFIYGGVYVRSNKHVIFDKSEADSACVNFFFHSSDTKDVVKGHVASIHGVNNDQDHIVLHVMSHNKGLLDTVGLHLKNAKSSYDQMIKSTHNTQQNYGCNKLSWVAVISHPHGTANSISFGRLKKEESELKRVIKYYDAATCPGSSGGLVVTPTLLHLQWPGAVHSSFCQKTRFNVSLDSRFQELDSSVIGQIYKNILMKKDSVPESQYRL